MMKSLFATLAFKIAQTHMLGNFVFQSVLRYFGNRFIYTIRLKEKGRIGRILQMHANHRKNTKVYAGI